MLIICTCKLPSRFVWWGWGVYSVFAPLDQWFLEDSALLFQSFRSLWPWRLPRQTLNTNPSFPFFAFHLGGKDSSSEMRLVSMGPSWLGSPIAMEAQVRDGWSIDHSRPCVGDPSVPLACLCPMHEKLGICQSPSIYAQVPNQPNTPGPVTAHCPTAA